VIDSVPVAELADNGYETAVYVVDGRSSTIHARSRFQKGAAIQTAFRAVDADYVIVADGDNTHPVNVATGDAAPVRLLQTNDVVTDRGMKRIHRSRRHDQAERPWETSRLAPRAGLV